MQATRKNIGLAVGHIHDSLVVCSYLTTAKLLGGCEWSFSWETVSLTFLRLCYQCYDVSYMARVRRSLTPVL